MRTSAILVALLLSSFCLPTSARSEQYVQGSKVVHTRLAPVVVHRVFPPFHGRHVYVGRTVRR